MANLKTLFRLRSALLPAVFCALMFTGCSSEKEVMRKQIATFKQNAQVLEGNSAQMRAQLVEKSKEVNRLQQEAQDAESRYQQEAQKRQALEDRTKARSQPLQTLAQRLKSLGFAVRPSGQRLIVNLAAGGELFNPGQVKLTAAARKRLGPVARALAGLARHCDVSVIGHSDNTPVKLLKDKYPTNYEVAFARARAVQSFLVKSGGLDPKLVCPASKAEFDPVASNKTPAGRSRNRRVELVVTPAE